MRLIALLLLGGALVAQTPRAIETLQTQVDELRDRLRQTKVERDILDERICAQKEEIAALKSDLAKLEPNDELKTKLSAQTKRQEALIEDLKSLRSAQADSQEEIAKLKKAIEALGNLLQNKPISCKSYTVKAGDTLEKIARNHGVTVGQLKQKNHLTDDRISVGRELTVE